MKHYVKPECKYKCRFLQINDGLWLCPHAAYGPGSYHKGEVAAARAALEQQGGYESVLARIQDAEQARREEREAQQDMKRKVMAESVRYE